MLIYGLLMILTVVFSTILISKEVTSIYIDNERQKLEEIAVLFASQNNDKPIEDLESAVADFSDSLDTRITIISSEPDALGEVLLDSSRDAQTMDNHKNREEIREALAGNSGMSIRESSSTHDTYLYRTFSDFTVDGKSAILRLAKPLHSMNLFTKQIVLINLMVLGGLFLIGLLIFNSLSSSVLQPLNDLSGRMKQMEDENSVSFLPKYREKQVDQLADSFNKLMLLLNENVDKLQQNNQELAAIFENVNSGLIVMDSEATVLMCNRPAVELLETTQEKFMKNRFFQNVRHPDLIEAVRSATSTMTKRTFEITWGNDSQYQIQLSPLHKAHNGHIIGILMVIENITDLRSMENMRKEFVANVSHELRTPLTTIRGFVETLLHDDLDNPEIIRKFLNIIDTEANRLQQMIFQLLYLSKLDSKVAKEDKSEIVINDFVERLNYTFEEEAKEKSMAIRFRISPADLTYLGSENLLMQITGNLISNALQYSQAEAVDVTFSEEGNALRLEVVDDGIGIAKKEQARIFERFYRVEKSRAQSKGGTGLGLSIVKHLAANTGGSIDLISDTNEGSRFIVILPNLREERF